MEIFIQPDQKFIQLDGVKTVRELIKKLGFMEEDVLVIETDSKRLLTPDEKLSPECRIEIRKVISEDSYEEFG